MGAYYTQEDITEYISKSTIIPCLFDKARSQCKIAFDGNSLSPSDGERARVRGSSSPPIHQSTTPPFHSPTVWNLLQSNPDRYIYPAVRHGTTWHYIAGHPSKGAPLENPLPLPPEIAAGLDATNPGLVKLRKPWNKPAPPEFALPTETWREVVARRQQYWRVWSHLTGQAAKPEWVANPPESADASPSPGGEGRGEGQPVSPITDINDLVTLNLDLRQFAQDVIQSSEDPDLLMAFWHAIASITVLDPTGGSGAFIFAALNILEPLYEACLERMEGFLAEWGESGSPRPSDRPLPSDGRGIKGEGKKLHPNYTKWFTEILQRVEKHPNRRYFILKSIIVNNLYAVDIMEEAVEICKLRLFLKLAAQVEPNHDDPNLGIEPLPDIDFNVRAGNTLVGYASAEEVRRCMKSEKTTGGDQMRLGVETGKDAYAEFEEQMLQVDAAFRKFREQQTELGGAVTAEDKRELQKRLTVLETKLNGYLARDYRIKATNEKSYGDWLKTHRPFNWLIEFYAIMSSGGFDVVIGNPPYVEYAKLKGSYQVLPTVFSCLPCGNLYALVIERCCTMLKQRGRLGMIVQLSAICTDRMQPLQECYVRHCNKIWASCYDDRPGKLFDGLEHIRATIILSSHTPCTGPDVCTTNLIRWYTEYREGLFPLIRYGPVSRLCIPGSFPKAGEADLRHILSKIRQTTKTLASLHNPDAHTAVYYYRSPLYWIRSMDFLPHFSSAEASRSVHHFKDFGLIDKKFAPVVGCVINSTAFYLWFIAYGNGRNVALRDIITFPAPSTLLTDAATEEMTRLFSKLMADYAKNSHMRHRADGVQFQEFYPAASKPILDEIDVALARHYAFTPPELEFILNYDIKFRLGRDTEEHADERELQIGL